MKDRLIARARAEGFVGVGVCGPHAIPEAPARLGRFLSDGHHGQMGWMGERVAWRGDPRALWPECRSVVMLAHSYAPEHDPLDDVGRAGTGAVSVYAQGRDYHDVVKKALKRVGRWLVEEAGCAIKVFVDTAPVMEKPLAQAAGLGWQGKHTNLLSRDWGNWAFLGAIFTTLELEPDAPEGEHCGSCTKCLDICPTDAFPAPFRLDATRCVSYLTIEHRGPVDPALRRGIGNRVYGCDDCLAVCPWNKFAVAAADLRYHGPHRAPSLGALVTLDDAGFRARFAGSPIKRIGRDRMVRNALYAIGNDLRDGGDPALAEVARELVDDPDEGVADAARWAVEQVA
ncbi:tRNA epoxyqueuosine(34) reductase QueG [Jannaschia sp. Os4]|uniref:tRNA epoxyqueuosine(34) reductase QueG n=1 Tax=Jannaschia sp. Os4 TaxID=2807617 RepID=UPI00193A4685|nr:tRNA epoxyqueuosine(34) reductase QueG [Jannaschia sp. Os4]MBM2575636.1 tRNA epoxyqueuosine(34) reductase QueG [Jannaschia sp. Os4]